ncbi:MAG: ATP-binding cassette domain-containing protein [Oscillospiraceae bacterium]|nr:ATP-binding cassette domain-containing protein [Oscillospiraceae bacterium]
MDEILLNIQHFSQFFGKFKAVDDVSFSVKKGEVFGLVGESGCGKTTTGRAIVGLQPISAGEILFEGKPIGKKRPTRSIQMIFQDPMASLDGRMTVREIIAEGLRIRGIKDRKALDEQVFSMMELVGLSREQASRYPHEFSGGQRQRIGIARALVLSPKLLIADEPVSALDVSIQAQVINLLSHLKEKLGLTVLFIAHDLSVVKYFSDRIGVMYMGKLVELADAEELFATPLHPYTKSLLSAVPLPDPRQEKNRVRISYDPDMHDYTHEKPDFRELAPGHWVYCSDEEGRAWTKSFTGI